MLPGGWMSKQFNSSKQLNKIKLNLQEIKNDNSPRLLENLQQIMNFFLGTSDNHGILFRFGNEFSDYQPLQWASQLQKLLQHIGPQSAAFGQLLKRNEDPNSQITISSAYLPSYFDPNMSSKTSLLSMRVVHLGISLPPLDAFFVMLAYAIYSSQPILPPITQYQHLLTDEFFASLSRNPLLVLLRKNIQFFNLQNKQIVQKIILTLRIFLMDQILYKHEQDRIKNGDQRQYLNQSYDASSLSLSTRKNIQLKYRLKVHHLHAIYLVLKYGVEYISAEFSKYMQALVEYFGMLRPDQFCLQALIRVWVYGLSAKNQSNIENDVVRVLSNANSKQGWFHLKRYHPSCILATSSMGQYNVQTALSILKLFEKQSYWVANPSYLFTLACFFRLLGCCKVFFNQFSNLRRANESKYDNFVEKVMKTVINRFNQNLADCMSMVKKNNPKQYADAIRFLSASQQIIEIYMNQYIKSKQLSRAWKTSSTEPQLIALPQQFKFKQIKQSDLINSDQRFLIQTSDAIEQVATQTRRNLVSFYRSQPRGCWEIPIQYNQSTILYYLLLTIAKIIDCIVPGKRQSPFLNIRFLANPINFSAFVVLIFVIILFMK